MTEQPYGTEDLIAAPATPRGRGALAVIRSSGPGCIETVARIFSRPEALAASSGHRVHHGWLLGSGGDRIDEVLITVFRGPASYTGQDSVEISCHGGTAVADRTMALLRGIGFRDASPGEFTFRAFASGKMDLTRAEAVREIIDARTDRARALAASRLAGAVEGAVDAAKAVVTRQAAAAALALDYPEDETEAVHFDFASIREARKSLERLISSWTTGRLYTEGLKVALAGPANAGKSSLFNLFLKEERSIVTETPGTTRDWVEAWLNLDGIPLRLMDTAGLRDDARNPVELEGMRRTRELLAGSDLVIAVADGSSGEDAASALWERELALLGDEPETAVPADRILRVWNKSDLAGHAPPGWLPISALTGEGFADLEKLIKARAAAGGAAAEEDAPVIDSLRQKNLLERAAAALGRFEDSESVPVDLLAENLHDALDALGELTGEVSKSDILDAMFREFCVGK